MEGRREKRVGRREGEMKEGRVGGGKEGVKIRIGAHIPGRSHPYATRRNATSS